MKNAPLTPSAAPKPAATASRRPIRRYRIARMPLSGRPHVIVSAKPS